MNTILFAFIDIIAEQTDIPVRQKKIYAVYSDLSGAFLNSHGIFEKGTAFLLEFSENYQINLSRTFWSNCSRMSGFFVFQKGGRKMAQSLKRASIAAPCCKKRITPERRRYATPPKETERKICSRSELCIGCPFPASGFICWGSGEDCLRSRYMKLQNREESK